MATHKSHKRVTNARFTRLRARPSTLVGPLALLATVGTVGAGVASTDPMAEEFLATGRTSLVDITDRDHEVSRNRERVELLAEPVAEAGKRRSPIERLLSERATARAIRRADTKLWTTTELNIWSSPLEDAKLLGELDAGEKVLVTGRHARGRDEIVIDGKSRWVTDGYLSEEKPTLLEGLSSAPCTNGSYVSAGVDPNIVLVHRAVCALWPEITTYGTFRSDGEHARGLAVDIMVSGATGYDVADYLRANYSELGISYIIYAQRIWSVDRAAEGWRPMEDRGSTTANHYDHVHVTVY